MMQIKRFTTVTVLILVASTQAPALGREPITVVDIQKTRLVVVNADAAPDEQHRADVVVLGGGLGGVAAALAACDAGRSVVLTEETDWLGGQATSQGVSALDENRYIETSGGTRSYLEFRRRIRIWYRHHTTLTATSESDPLLDPGNSWVSRLTFEPKAAVTVIDGMLTPHCEQGKLTILRRHRIIAAARTGRRIDWVDVVDLDTCAVKRLVGLYYLDATELGDPLETCRVQHVVGAESFEQTGEPSAGQEPHPEWVQSYTYPFALRLTARPGPPITRPHGYERNRVDQPYTLRHLYHDQRGWVRYGMFETAPGSYGPFWTYRRIIDRANFEDSRYVEDIAMINWPGNDYRGWDLISATPQQMLQALREAKDLALGLCHWLQAEAPRDDDGHGYPELALAPGVMGTQDGLAKHPYIRESRRIRALDTIVEQDVAARYHDQRARARHFADSVGIGYYGIDIHPNQLEKKIPPSATKPFQIPLGALVSIDTDNLIPACKNIGTTHITNGCYRLHPVEWNIGEAAGMLAVSCILHHQTPAEIHRQPGSVLHLQRGLVKRGVPIFWYADMPLDDGQFSQAQLAPFTDPAELERLADTLNYLDGD